MIFTGNARASQSVYSHPVEDDCLLNINKRILTFIPHHTSMYNECNMLLHVQYVTEHGSALASRIRSAKLHFFRPIPVGCRIKPVTMCCYNHCILTLVMFLTLHMYTYI